jgi:hypothetical protein
MSKLRFETVEIFEMIQFGDVAHSFYNEARAVTAVNKKRLTRLTSEMASLQASLPISFGSSIFIRVDESRLDMLKALIIGPAG